MRAPDWRTRLTAWFAAHAREPFVHGRHDCALFAFGAVAAMGGPDLAAPWRGRYTTLRGGIRLLRRDGHEDHVALAASALEEIAPARARPGDLAVVSTPEGPALGVVSGATVHVLGPAGLALVPRGEAVRAFRVPE